MDNTEEKDVLTLNSITSIKLPGYSFFNSRNHLIKINMDLKRLFVLSLFISVSFKTYPSLNLLIFSIFSFIKCFCILNIVLCLTLYITENVIQLQT